jgi:predicted GNAT superfamily acetyltransferase
MEIDILKSDQDIRQMLALQSANLEASIQPHTALKEGFLTVRHNYDLIAEMQAKEPQVIIRDQGQIVAYLLAMPKCMRNSIPILVPFFDQLDRMHYNGRSLKEVNYILNGQVCVAKSHRGKGTFDLLFKGMKQYLAEKYTYVVTEIAQRNTRSLKAHQRVGFQVLSNYISPQGEDWAVVLWDWD